jgi:hypothetical protein
MLRKSARSEKAETKVEVQIKNVSSSLNLDLDLSLPHLLRPCWSNAPGSLAAKTIEPGLFMNNPG